MKISSSIGMAGVLVVLAAVGGGTFVFRNLQETRRQELQQKTQEAKLKTKEEARREAEANAKAKEAEARTAEAKRKTAEAEKAAAEKNLAAKRESVAAEKARKDAAATESVKATKVKAAAEAETAKAKAAQAKAEAEKAAADAKAKVEALARDKAAEERRKAEAELARVALAKEVADAALAKSENERKTAEANAVAEHDRKLRMYRRAETSRAEMVELQKAERLLALEESGGAIAAVDAADDEPGASTETTTDGAAAPTQQVVSVTWPDAADERSPATRHVLEADRAHVARLAADRRRRSREHVVNFEAMVERAEREGRTADVAYYRRTLVSLVPDYPLVCAELIEEARRDNRPKDADYFCTALMAFTPEWARVGVMLELLARDEAYYSKMLAGRVTKDEFVKAFRKRYDRARRGKGDQDERDAEMAHICSVLATYVPDYERSPEWK